MNPVQHFQRINDTYQPIDTVNQYLDFFQNFRKQTQMPVGMGVGGDSTLEVAGHQDWLDSLSPGAYCRLFLLGRWMTAQLNWVSEAHNLFLFTSRHGGRNHSMTRRMLGKLRNAGLATSIEDGSLLAQAMQQLADTGFAPA